MSNPVVIPPELVKELRNCLSFTSYSSEDDSVGHHACCFTESYEGHTEDCPVGKLLKLLEQT